MNRLASALICSLLLPSVAFAAGGEHEGIVRGEEGEVGEARGRSVVLHAADGQAVGEGDDVDAASG